CRSASGSWSSTTARRSPKVRRPGSPGTGVSSRPTWGRSTSLLSGEAISAWYGDVQVLRQVSFEVQEREIVAIVGANAAGKSTLLLTVSGILPHLGGRMTGVV